MKEGLMSWFLPDHSIVELGLWFLGMSLFVFVILLLGVFLISCFVKPPYTSMARKQGVTLLASITLGLAMYYFAAIFACVGFGILVLFGLWFVARIIGGLTNNPNLLGINKFESFVSKIYEYIKEELFMY